MEWNCIVGRQTVFFFTTCLIVICCYLASLLHCLQLPKVPWFMYVLHHDIILCCILENCGQHRGPPLLCDPPFCQADTVTSEGWSLIRGDIYTKMWDLVWDFDSLITGNCWTESSHKRGNCWTEASCNRGNCWSEGSHNRRNCWTEGSHNRGNCWTDGSHNRGTTVLTEGFGDLSDKAEHVQVMKKSNGLCFFDSNIDQRTC